MAISFSLRSLRLHCNEAHRMQHILTHSFIVCIQRLCFGPKIVFGSRLVMIASMQIKQYHRCFVFAHSYRILFRIDFRLWH